MTIHSRNLPARIRSPRFRPALCIAAAFVATLAGCATPEEAGPVGSACASPRGPDGPGFVRYAYYVSVEDAPEGGMDVRVPLPVNASGEPAALVDCLVVEEGDATWEIVGGAGNAADAGADAGAGDRYLLLHARSSTAFVRGAFLFDSFSNETLRGNNWSLSPVVGAVAGNVPPPQDSPNARPIGTTRFDAGASDARVKVYFALDASPNDARVVHQQDVAEAVTRSGEQEVVVFRDYRLLG